MYTSYMGRARAGPWVLGRCPGAGPAAAQGLGRFGEHVCVRVRAAARALGPGPWAQRLSMFVSMFVFVFGWCS